MTQETLKTNQDTNLQTEKHENEMCDYEVFKPTFIDTLQYKISSMSKIQVILLFGCVVAVDICLTMLAIYLYNHIN
jgi:hypothetical protein